MSNSPVISEQPRKIGAAVGGFVLTPIFLGLAVDTALREDAPAVGGRAVWALLFVAIAAFCAWLFLWRGMRMGVIPREDTLEVRGMLRTRHVAWSEIQRFSFNGFGVAEAVLRDGGRMRLTGITSSQSYGKDDLAAQALLAQLDRELARHRPALR